MKYRDETVSAFLRRRVRLDRLVDQFHDVRRNPVIPLRNLIGMIFCMPFFGQTSMLGVDRAARRERHRLLFDVHERRDHVEMVGSDSTLQRMLRWISPSETRNILIAIARRLDRLGLLTAVLAPRANRHRIGIVDGSILGKFYAVCVTLFGSVRMPLIIEPTGGQGKELPTAKLMLKRTATIMGSHAPTLWLVDGLYFTESFFSLVRNELHAHLLITCKDPDFRFVTSDAELQFNTASLNTEATSGFDRNRWCSWTMKSTSGEFAGFPVQVLRLHEHFPKRRKNRDVVTWIATTDLTLSCQEIREAAHLRWQIENNVFKRFSHLCDTKRFWFKDQRPYFSMVRLFAASVAACNAFISIVCSNDNHYNRIMRGAKFTWKTFFSQLEDQLPPCSIARILATSC